MPDRPTGTTLGRWSVVAAMFYEPYMVLQDGLLFAIDGRAELAVPIRAG
jgi:hypothetical protein